MYIKELEERTRASTQSESERNKALIQEAAELRKAALKVRSQVLKISVALTCIGAEVGRILNVQGAEELEDDEDMEEEQEEEEDSGTDSGGRGTHAQSSGHRLSLKGQTQSPRSSSAGPSLEVGSPSKSQPHIRSASLSPEPLDTSITDMNQGQTEPTIPEETYEEPVGVAEPGSMALESFDAELFANSGFASAIPTNRGSQELDSGLLEDQPSGLGAMGSLHPQDTVGTDATHSRTYMPFTMIPAQTGLVLPPGLLPNSPGVNYRSPHSSMFSEHIEALELQARCKLDAAPDRISRHGVSRCCTSIMSLFTLNAWPRTHSVWFKSQVPDIIGPILRWRIHPTTETYNSLLPEYRPTPAQLSVPHSAVIDWVPYAGLRDRVIMYYNQSAALDRLLCDMLNSYVIEVNDISQILPQAPSGRAYFGVWNVYSAIDSASASLRNDRSFNKPHVHEGGQNFGPEPNMFQDLLFNSISPSSPTNDRVEHQNLHRPDRSNAFNLLEVLTTPALVLKLSHDICLYAAKSWRIDPGLFTKWPELKFEGYEELVAKGRSYRIPTAPPDAPIEMTDATKKMYQEAFQSLA